jgi:hypothetical protein
MRAPSWLRRRMIEDMAVASWGPMRFEARLRAASASRHSSTACPTRSPRRVRTGGTANRYELVEKISRGPCYAPATGKKRHGVYAFVRKDRQVPRPHHLRSGRRRSARPTMKTASSSASVHHAMPRTALGFARRPRPRKRRPSDMLLRPGFPDDEAFLFFRAPSARVIFS